MGEVLELSVRESSISIVVLISVDHVLYVDLLTNNVRIFNPKKLILKKSGIDFEILIGLWSLCARWTGGGTAFIFKISTICPEWVVVIVDLHLS